RREAEGAVRGRVALAADPEQPQIEQPERARENALANQPAPRQILDRALTKRRQRASEPDHLVELLAVAVLAPTLVVEILLASRVVLPGRLDVAHRVGADPYVGPRRGNRHRAHPRQDARV